MTAEANAMRQHSICCRGTSADRRRSVTRQKRFVTISVVRYRELLDAKQQRDAVINALGAAWLDLHDWVSVAKRQQREMPNRVDAPWAATDLWVRDAEQTLAIITDTLRNLARDATARFPADMVPHRTWLSE
jgi:hypothetical protein